MDIAYNTLLVDRRPSVDWVSLHRPERLNALSREMVEELCDYFDSVSRSTTVRVIVLRGSGRAFCAGFDIQEGLPDQPSTMALLAVQRRYDSIITGMRRCPQPVVALLKGAATGGGFSLALAADVRLAGQSLRMNAAYIKLGFSGTDMGSSYFLPRYVGMSVAAELLLTGRYMDAERALSTGLVSEVHPDERLDAAGEALVEDMLQASPLGLRLTKETLNANVDAPSLEAAIALEDRNQILCASSPEVAERTQAFLKKSSSKSS